MQSQVVHDSVKEVIPLGYGTVQDDLITGSIVFSQSEDFNKGNIQQPLQLVQGKIAGMAVSKAGGDPNKDFYIRIRGLNTFESYSQPLIVIDGVPSGYERNLDPNDIASFTVLKDAASSSMYGMRGANGVIIIETKKGNRDSSYVEYNGYLSFEQVAKNKPVMDADSWRALSAEVGQGTDFGTETDWYKQILNNTLSTVHNISTGGQVQNSSWRFALNYRNINGALLHSGFEQYNGRFNLSQEALKNRLKIELSLAGSDREMDLSFEDAFHYAPIMNPTAPVYSDDPAMDKFDGFHQEPKFDYYNPVAILELNKNLAKQRTLEVSIRSSILVAKGLTFDIIYADLSNRLSGYQYFDKNEYYYGYLVNGKASRRQDDSHNRFFATTFQYLAEISSFKIGVRGGYNFQEFINEGFGSSVSNFLTDDFSFNNLAAALDSKHGVLDVSSYKNDHRLAAFYGNLNISWKRLMLNTGVRYEGSSRLGSQNKMAYFPSLGLGYRITRNIKLRVSYGIAGNTPPQNYLSQEKIIATSVYFPTYGIFRPLYIVTRHSNKYLKSEKKKEFNFGIDFQLLGSRLVGNFDYYKSNASQLLMDYGITNLVTYPDIWLNTGEIENSGKELNLRYLVLKKSGFSYHVTLSASWGLKNKIVNLTGQYDGNKVGSEKQRLGILGSPGGCCSYITDVEEGRPVGQLIGYKFDRIDENGYLVLKDLDENGYIDNLDLAVIGNALPKALLGFGHSVNYKQWAFELFFRGDFGHHLLNTNRANYEYPYMVSAYNVPETTDDLRNQDNGKLMAYGSLISDRHIEDASYVALDYLYAGYFFKVKGSFSATLYIAGNNLFYFTKYLGADPNPRYYDENISYGSYNSPLVPGADRRESWSRTRSFTLGIRMLL